MKKFKNAKIPNKHKKYEYKPTFSYSYFLSNYDFFSGTFKFTEEEFIRNKNEILSFVKSENLSIIKSIDTDMYVIYDIK